MAITSTWTVGRVIDSIAKNHLDDKDHKIWTPIAIRYALEEALVEVTPDIERFGRGILNATSSIAYITGTYEYSLPTDFWKALRVRLQNATYVEQSVRLPYVPFEDFGVDRQGWCVRQDKILIYFTTTGYTAYIDYVRKPTVPTTMAGTFDLPDDWVLQVMLRAALTLKTDRNLPVGGTYARQQQHLEKLQLSRPYDDSDVTGNNSLFGSEQFYEG